ncbi:NADPH-dependent oxidoreductase [Sphingomonas sp. MAH-20]|uniref:NADPH-dependent oxidoreductase n=1 Tax=Sphingomonas horti TaxID=2682842 RepID=A0A6I4J4G4_9SPHN|nr:MULTISPECIES: NAD(P)H-dependent oxidoreductase [Sphingomonas]MBA2919052.1 NAD(P)H-dependent oxidoreductase [Sphingomonas sp. CGMCC 1.13658]MVO79084.1 NADPH-dependent oxidoreductase [Sphingomonas horti]
MALSAIALNCTLKPEGESSTDRMIGLIAGELAKHDVRLAETIRVARHDVKPGVTSDEGAGDAWPAIRAKILAADVLILGTPVWLGQMSSIAKRVLERMDAFLGETDDQGRTPAYGKTVLVGIVGNEDGAHSITASLLQALNDVGFSVPAAAATYWVGEAMGKTDFKDLPQVPDKIAATARAAASNAAHLARLLRRETYPGSS